MTNSLKLYNTLTRQKETFEPLNPPFVGMYVCGPTVYNDAHIGNARPAVVFDVLYRYLQFLGYKVRYVRNITDVGHLLGETNEGEDRIAKQARLEQLEPMEIVYRYTQRYHEVMDKLQVKRPSIEPTATGHIVEQINIVQQILDNGLAYISEGSVYFDIEKYNQKHPYGELSGRVIDELINNTRNLDGQDAKKSPLDFALWKKAQPEHLMRWQSPWGEGFPGWHIECTVMSTKYLGETFDIHGGGMDLMFPHHECEIAQAKAATNKPPVRYWLHNNMITINGEKMSKSAGNFVTIAELLTGEHPILEQSYSPMTMRFFILQAHYRSTLDFTNFGLQSAQKGYKKIMNALRTIEKMEYSPDEKAEKDEKNETQILQLLENLYKGLNDDLNTALSIGHLFNLVKKINGFYAQPQTLSQISATTFEQLKNTFTIFVRDILGLIEERPDNQEGLIQVLLQEYAEAKNVKNYEKVDTLRNYFKTNGLIIKDTKQGIDWSYDEN
ncbi:MAG: cysteine--tRNA ligase [Cytophagales bacterium]|nr:MAG: cysteine--tRNA ligase [Cytophagales bacterium]